MESIALRNYYSPYQYVTVSAGSSETIWYFTVYDKDMVLFIDIIGNNYIPNTKFIWEIDGEVIEEVDRIIGRLDNPEHFDPPFVVRSYMKVTAVNNDSVSHVLEWLSDGYLISKEDLRNGIES